MKNISILALLVTMAFTLPNQRPIIGIFTQSTDSNEPTLEDLGSDLSDSKNTSYIAASYIKYIQMSGAQVIPIFAYSD